ncbi:hypothetical protein AB5I41_05840 [Sphingomonas sp. MMS24-JH45]
MGVLQRIVGEVVWVERRLAGLRFDRAIDLAAARKPRARKPFVPHAGWLDNLTHAYRHQGSTSAAITFVVPAVATLYPFGQTDRRA